ncbi:hypothetical protein H2204_009777 [Knufia peltigerae]|uniref:Cyclohexanone monooxygenase n=1 Tax=Knufia peltigerae TaxID=1002370 RepID=A0AA38XYB2_9EURO|nr:hypothetical protein H2204_009777 [Knufia peltigerae]
MAVTKLDALVVGAGFGGLYQLYSLLKLGLSVKVIDQAGDVGGTWYWNRYPGAMSDTEAFAYRYSWDKDDLQHYPWTERYVKQPEVLAYLRHVVKRHDLRRHIQFNTEFLGAAYDEAGRLWRVQTSSGVMEAHYLITALGILNATNWPDIPGIDVYRGELYHTSRFPETYDFKGKRVGVVGCGSTGVQVISAIAKDVKTLTCFQRRPQYTIPANDGPVSKEYRDRINKDYDAIWDHVKTSASGMGFEESKVSALSVSEEERNRVFEECWRTGNGLRFNFGLFADIATNREANEAACVFIRNKIRSIVKDPETARKLTPWEPFARRPLCDTGYYETFNRENVELVDLKATPIVELTEDGIQTSDGKTHELDVIIMATGFDAFDGSYNRVCIRGRNGETLRDHWAIRPSTYLGTAVSGFPNFFMISGPLSAFSNVPPALEMHVEFITGIIARAKELVEEDLVGGRVNGTSGMNNGEAAAAAAAIKRRVELEALPEAEADWFDKCTELCTKTLYWETKSWFWGDNVKGKGHRVLFFLGGLGAFNNALLEAAAAGYKGFRPFCGIWHGPRK